MSEDINKNKSLAAPLPEPAMTGQYDTNCPNCNGDPCLPSCKYYVSPLPEIASEELVIDDCIQGVDCSYCEDGTLHSHASVDKNKHPELFGPVPLGEGAIPTREAVYEALGAKSYYPVRQICQRLDLMTEGERRMLFRAVLDAALASKAVPDDAQDKFLSGFERGKKYAERKAAEAVPVGEDNAK